MSTQPRVAQLDLEYARYEDYRGGRKLSATSPLRRAVWARDRGRCVLCGVACKRDKANRYDADPTLGEIDHITPVCRRGTNELANLRLLCKRCNRRKAAYERRER